MLSVNSTAAADAEALASYYGNLAREDYYTAGGEPPGQWLGAGAKHFGLNGEVREGELVAVMRGFHPRDKTSLIANAGEEHKPGWDCTFSAPKSVSVIWAVSDRDTQIAIQRVHAGAVKAAVDYLERDAISARRGKGGVEQERTSGIVAAAYEHSTNRNADPQLHTLVLRLSAIVRPSVSAVCRTNCLRTGQAGERKLWRH